MRTTRQFAPHLFEFDDPFNFYHHTQLGTNDVGRKVDANYLWRTFHTLKQVHILPYSVTGTVYVDDIPIQTFWINIQGIISFKDILDGDINKFGFKAQSFGSGINSTEGIIYLLWTGPVGGYTHIVTSYEFEWQFNSVYKKRMFPKIEWKKVGF